MAKPEWGTKRRCLSCGAAFYDLAKSPIHCPKCGTEFNPEAIAKSRRPAKPEEKVKVPPKAVVVDDVADVEVADADAGDDLIEAADDLEEEDVAEEIDVDADTAGDEER